MFLTLFHQIDIQYWQMSDHRKVLTKKVVKAGEIYQRLEIVADAVINDTAQRDAIATGERL